jgi:hypothetical protein
VGSSVGGALAKICSIEDHIRVITVNSPVINVWLLGYASEKASVKSFAHNIAINGLGKSLYGNLEDGGTNDFIAYDNFPKKLPGTAGVSCLMAIQCNELEYYRDYCESALGNNTLNELITKSPFTIK